MLHILPLSLKDYNVFTWKQFPLQTPHPAQSLLPCDPPLTLLVQVFVARGCQQVFFFWGGGVANMKEGRNKRGVSVAVCEFLLGINTVVVPSDSMCQP